MIETSIVIPTYRRPEALERTIASCLAQDAADGSVEILVVDNDVAEPARLVAERLAAQAALPVRYLVERRPGISHARNTGVAAAKGRYVVFIDDDEEAVAGWLAGFLRTIRETAADLVVGPVYPRFPEASAIVPVDPHARDVFTRDAGVPTRTVLPRWGGIGNTILDKERCFVDDVPFDPRLGLTGGEDALFLRGLAVRCRTLVWCAEAAVHETIPAGKLAPAYLLQRAFRGGQITTFVEAAAPRTARSLLRTSRWMAIGAAQVLVYTPAGLVLRALGNPRWLTVLAKASSGLGKILWHRHCHLRLYRKEPRMRRAPSHLADSPGASGSNRNR